MSTAQLSAGTVVDGSYTVGNMLRMRPGATTYDATDVGGVPVVVTIYDAACFPSTLVLERCLRELRQLQSIASSRIVEVLACGKHGDGLYEVNAPMPPHALEEHLQGGALPLQDAGAIIVQVGEALLEAQRVGVVHRNLGANVVFPSPEGVKLAGFAVGEPHGDQSFGPLHTLAPEQVEGKVVDQRTLIYNLAALMHWMMTGRPLFMGDPATVLQQHLHADPPAEVHGALVRALGKDPRMRPMILKQFLVELAAVGGVQPPRVQSGPVAKAPPRPVAKPTPAPASAPAAAPAAKPSTRGWTMFMQAQDDDVAAAPAPAPAPAAAPAQAAAPAPAPAAKPSTRGWTMFMEAQEDAPAAAAPQPAAPVQPQPAAPVQPQPVAPAGAKPSTRGWTMFMEAEEAAPTEAPTEAPQAAEAAPAPAAPAAKPSTRGWTMFMEDEGAEQPASQPAPAPEPAQPVAAAPAPAAPAAKPSTRGWTMFMEAEEAAPGVSSAAAVTAPITTPGSAAPAAAPSAAGAPAQPAGPSSRGWTMFMEPGAEAATPAAEPPVAEPPQPEPEPEPELDAPNSTKRGWTMFMDAPLADAKGVGGPETPEAPVDGASDNKGWTVFGAPAPNAAAAKAPATAPQPQAPEEAPVDQALARGKTVMVDGFQPVPPPGAEPMPHLGGGPLAAPHPALPQGSTVPSSQPAMTTDDSLAKPSGSKLPLVVVLVVVVAAIATLAFMFLG